MQVSDKVRKEYLDGEKTKRITLYFPELNLTLGKGKFYSESMHLTEKLVDSQSIEFVGCIASKFKIQVHDLKEDIKGKRMIATIHTDATENEPVTLFNGIVDSAVKQSNKRVKEITAYDELYSKGNKEVASWYKSLAFPLTLKQIRDSLFNYIGIGQEETELPNDNTIIKRQYDPNSLRALSVIKAICQINGAFGIINRNGRFEYRILGVLDMEDDGLYPVFYPGANAFPGVSMSALNLDNVDVTKFGFYESARYEEFMVKPVDKLTIRQTEEDAGVSYGTGQNNYIIQGNMFTYGLAESKVSEIARNIYPNIQGFSYYPFSSKNNGIPYVECGVDAASYMMIDWEATENSQDVIYEQKKFYILNRELSGIQALKDSYSAEGEEYQSEFITDLQTQIDVLKQNTVQNIEQKIEDYTYGRDTIDDMFANFGGGFANIESVDIYPGNGQSGTLYVVKGEVVIE